MLAILTTTTGPPRRWSALGRWRRSDSPKWAHDHWPRHCPVECL